AGGALSATTGRAGAISSTGLVMDGSSSVRYTILAYPSQGESCWRGQVLSRDKYHRSTSSGQCSSIPLRPACLRGVAGAKVYHIPARPAPRWPDGRCLSAKEELRKLQERLV